jgi:hypothetical protein
LKKAGAANDIDASKFTFKGEGGGTYTLVGSPDIDITSGTEFSITLDAADKAAVNVLLNKEGTLSEDNTVYNLEAAEDWAAGADPAINVIDATTPITAGGFNVTISGTVTNSTNPIQGATITFSHNGHTEATAADGTYSYIVPSGITTTITPSHPGYGSWNPASRTINNISADQPGQDFVSTSDTDGVSTTEESGPDGTDPNYDGNSDGIPDCQQNNVASLHTADGSNYVTIAAPAGTELSGVQALPSPAPGIFPDRVSFPYGLFSFTVSGVAPGGSAQVSLIFSGSARINSYWKYGKEPGNTTDHAYIFHFTGGTGAQITGNTVVLNFMDGQRGDDDLDGTNGIIVDDGGPGSSIPTVTSLSREGMVVFALLIPALACWMIRRKRLLN